MLNDVSPSAALDDTVDRPITGPVLPSDCGYPRTASEQRSDVPHIRLRKHSFVVHLPNLVPASLTHLVHVLFLGSHAQVGWEATGRRIARMEDQPPVGNGADVKSVRNTVRASMPIDFVLPVPIFIDTARPQPAFISGGRRSSHAVFELLLEGPCEPSAVVRVTSFLPSPVVRPTPPSSPCEFIAPINTARSFFLLRWGHDQHPTRKGR